MAIFVTSSTRDTNKRQSIYRRPKWSEYYENFSQLQIENYKCSTRLWLSYFICDKKHTFVKQMSPDLAMLLAFLLETVDWLDNFPILAWATIYCLLPDTFWLRPFKNAFKVGTVNFANLLSLWRKYAPEVKTAKGLKRCRAKSPNSQTLKIVDSQLLNKQKKKKKREKKKGYIKSRYIDGQ